VLRWREGEGEGREREKRRERVSSWPCSDGGCSKQHAGPAISPARFCIEPGAADDQHRRRGQAASGGDGHGGAVRAPASAASRCVVHLTIVAGLPSATAVPTMPTQAKPALLVPRVLRRSGRALCFLSRPWPARGPLVHARRIRPNLNPHLSKAPTPC
jgi:hypothetical protein